MKEIIEKLGQCELPDSIGFDARSTIHGRPVIEQYADAPNHHCHGVYFDSDDKPGSALFIVRGLKVLGKRFDDFRIRVHDDGGGTCLGWRESLPEGEPYLAFADDAPTIAQAVALALIAVFGGEA